MAKMVKNKIKIMAKNGLKLVKMVRNGQKSVEN